MLHENNTIALNNVFFALSDPTRRRILELLLKNDLYASQISNEFLSAMPTISRHLRVLTKCNLVSKRREAQKIKYAIQIEALNQAQIWFETLGAASPVDYDKLESLFSSL